MARRTDLTPPDRGCRHRVRCDERYDQSFGHCPRGLQGKRVTLANHYPRFRSAFWPLWLYLHLSLIPLPSYSHIPSYPPPSPWPPHLKPSCPNGKYNPFHGHIIWQEEGPPTTVLGVQSGPTLCSIRQSACGPPNSGQPSSGDFHYLCANHEPHTHRQWHRTQHK